MPKEFTFFAYLLESYAQRRGLTAAKVLELLEAKGQADFVYDMYELYHAESIENAFTDLDSLIATGQPAW